MVKRLSICAVLFILAVGPSAAQIDPQSLVGVWEGQWSRRTQRTELTGPAVVTISKVEGGKVYGKTETMGSRENPAFEWVGDVSRQAIHMSSREGQQQVIPALPPSMAPQCVP